jgi:hypothetical protein
VEGDVVEWGKDVVAVHVRDETVALDTVSEDHAEEVMIGSIERVALDDVAADSTEGGGQGRTIHPVDGAPTSLDPLDVLELIHEIRCV